MFDQDPGTFGIAAVQLVEAAWHAIDGRAAGGAELTARAFVGAPDMRAQTPVCDPDIRDRAPRGRRRSETT
jgi:hypothetical protein